MRCALLCLLVALPLIGPTALPAADPKLSQQSTANSAPLPFRIFDGYVIVVQSAIGDAGKIYNLMIDTGATPSVIDVHVAAKLGLTGRKVAMALPNGSADAQLAELPAFSLGPIRRTNLPVLVRDLAYIQPYLGTRIDGIVGMDVLAAMNFTIDYQHRVLLFGAAALSDGEAADFASGPPFVTVMVNIDGEPMKMLVDTGHGGTMLFKTQTKGRLRDARFQGAAGGVNMAGRLNVEQLILRELRLGKVDFHEYPATLLNDKAEWGGAFDGLLGPSGLHLKNVTFDFEHGKLRWNR